MMNAFHGTPRLLATLFFAAFVPRAWAATPEEMSHEAGLAFDGGRALPGPAAGLAQPAEPVEIITLAEFAQRLSQDPKAVDDLIEAIRKGAGSIAHGWPGLDGLDPQERERLVKAIQQSEKAFLDRFPTMTLDQLKVFITLYGQRQGVLPAEPPYPAAEDLVLTGQPKEAADGAFLKDWGHGLYHGDQTRHGLDTAYGDNVRFAEVLNRLALNWPGQAPVYTLRLGAESFTTVEAFLEHLARTGHTVTAHDMRFFANFGGIWYRQNGRWVSVVTPLFLDTGAKLPSGQELIVPVSHTHLELNVRGPAVNADVIYYLGVGGASMFYPQATEDKPWVGGRAAETWAGARAIELAGRAAVTRREIKAKVEKYKLPLGGYGILGGCGDVQAMITGKPVYPQVRDMGYYRDGMTIDAWAAALPVDASAPPVDLKRVYDSLPVVLGELKIPQSRPVVQELTGLVKKP